MYLINAFLLGFIEALTEFLPISSTAHLIIFGQFLKVSTDENLQKVFDVVIQAGAILAVVVYFYRQLFNFKQYKQTLNLYYKMFLTFLPVGLIGFFLHDIIKNTLFDLRIVPFSLILGGVVILFIVKKTANKDTPLHELGFLTCLAIGLFQALAVIPGISRSGACLVGLILMGFSRTSATQTTFIISIPSIFAASLYDLYKNYHLILATQENFVMNLILGFFASFFASIFVIKYFLGFVRKFGLGAFGYYRIILGLCLLYWLYI